MAESVITARKLFVGGYDLSGDMNAMNLTLGNEAQDNTRFGQVARTFLPGLGSVSFTAAGLWDSNAAGDQPDNVLPPTLAVAGNIVTVGAQTGAAGEVAWLFRAGGGSYNKRAAVGRLFDFDFAAYLSHETPIRGTILANGSQAGTGNGTAYQVGAVSATQYLYAALHVVSGTFGSITVKVQSATDQAFTIANDRVTFTPAVAVAGQWATRVPGAIVDTWWRMNVSALAGGPMTVVLSIGIL